MSIKNSIKKILIEEITINDTISYILRRVDLDSVIKYHTKYSLSHLKPRILSIPPLEFVDRVIYSTYIDEITPLFDSDAPISEKIENKIESTLFNTYKNQIINDLEKEKLKFKNSRI